MLNCFREAAHKNLARSFLGPWCGFTPTIPERGGSNFQGQYMNRLPWFTHDHDAHQDQAIRAAIRKHGHIAGWVYWVTLELLHKHGVGDTLKMPLIDMAASMMVDKRTCKGVYETLCEVRLIDGASYEHGAYTTCTVIIKKFRERQANLKSKIISRQSQDHSKTTIEREEERERHTSPQKGLGFDLFWTAYPSKKAKAAALKAWSKLSPDEALRLQIFTALENQKMAPAWTKDSGQYIPLAASWLNGKRWEDETHGSGSREFFA